MYKEPNLGRCGNGKLTVSKQLQNLAQEMTTDNTSAKNVKYIADKLDVSTSAVYAALKKLDRNESNTQCLTLPHSLSQGNNTLRGVYIASSTQILAVCHTAQESSVISEDVCLMTYDSSDVEYRERMFDINNERVLTLATQSLISFPNRRQGKIQSPADFIQTIMNTQYVDGGNTMFLVNSNDTNEISDYISAPSVLYTNVSFEDIKVTWHRVIDLGNSAANLLLNKISEFVNKSSNESNPFIWRAARIVKEQSVPFYLNSKCLKRTLFITAGRENSSGNMIICTSYCYDDVPSTETFAKSANLEEYLSNIDELDTSLIKNAQNALNCMEENTLCHPLDLDSLSNSNSNAEEKQRLAEVETRIGRPSAVINSQIDTSSLSSHARLWSPSLKKQVINMTHHSSF